MDLHRVPPSISFAAHTMAFQRKSSIYTTIQRTQDMSIPQTYLLAHTARGKLRREAARANHDLRHLVGHANLLDCLRIDLANAEQKQEQWLSKIEFDAKQEEAEIRDENLDMEEPEGYWEIEDAQSSYESSYEEQSKLAHRFERISTEFDMEFDDEEDQSLTLTRTASRYSVPELSVDAHTDLKAEHMSLSPRCLTVNNSTARDSSLMDSGSVCASKKDASLSELLASDGFYLPSRQ